ncbi:hypothetical protein [Apibacter sp. HY039]|uniref:hypothetical protein n=1 Tax=Apibacter sp. HY039 TaxID=2501476 RepID=UPI000FEBF84D|nr:hypothetical protein [Apibacter sp. HY039]
MRIELKNRIFKIWKYSVTHSMLLLRSPKNSEFTTNIDLIFSGVKIIKLPNIFKGNSITSISIQEDQVIMNDFLNQNINLEEVYVFNGDKIKYYVVASMINIEENDSDIFETKF